MLVLAGKNNIAVNALNYIIDNYSGDFSVICNRTDDGSHGWQRSLRRTASEKCVKEISLDEAYREAEIFISLEFDKIVRPENFKKAKAYNIHFSLLPKYKGMYTSIWPILNDEPFSGVTLHEIDHGIDTGSIIDQIVIPVGKNDRSRDLYRKYLAAGYQLFERRIDDLLVGRVKSQAQPASPSTYNSKASLDFSNLRIDLFQTAHALQRQIYAFSFREYQLPTIFGERISEVEILEDRSVLKPGQVIKSESNFIDLSTVDFDVRIFFDRIDRIGEFSNCTVVQASELLRGVCGVHDRNERGWSPIIIAAYHGNYDVVKYLLGVGADIHDRNYNGTSLLMYAKDYSLKARDRQLFDYLVEEGADLNQRDFSGKRLADYLSQSEKLFLGIG